MVGSVTNGDGNTEGAIRTQIPPASVQRAAGKDLRKSCSRASHKEQPHPDPRRDVIALIERSNEDRVEQLVPVRHSRMMESPFSFFRGSAILQTSDLAHTPASGIHVQACGDCHLLNFGGFATPERNLVFDINDFDETSPGPWEWDIKRLAVSLVLAARWRGFSPASARDAVSSAVARYQTQMNLYADMATLEIWYARNSWDDILGGRANQHKLGQLVNATVKRAQHQNSEHVFGKLITDSGDGLRIIDRPPIIYHIPETNVATNLSRFLEAHMASLRDDHRALFQRFRFIDAAMKVVGVGSVGTRCLITLMLGDQNDPLLLQIKEARKSVLESYVDTPPWRHQGERVVAGQRLMQAVSDVFLGWARGPAGRDFYIRQLRDMKVAIELEMLDASMLEDYGALCGATLARAHAKAGQAARISGYLGGSWVFVKAIEEHATAYADQVERDYETFRSAVKAGRIQTETSASDLEVMIS
jgi:uncharacterized protein (DUF2252 family)